MDKLLKIKLRLSIVYKFLFAFLIFSISAKSQTELPKCEGDISVLFDGNFCQGDTVKFKIFFEEDNVDLTVNFYDGEKIVYTDLKEVPEIKRYLEFDCNSMPWEPEDPKVGDHFFQYKDKIIIIRDDCVDDDGLPVEGSFDFNVIPNPINQIIKADDCVDNLSEIEFEADICNNLLVEKIKWYVDGIEVSDSTILTGVFDGPGEYDIQLGVDTYSENEDCSEFRTPIQTYDITVKPQINISFNIDSTELCKSIIEIPIINNSLYTESYNWTSNSDNVTFSDNASPQPIITINNNEADTYSITLIASNNDCDPVERKYQITTLVIPTISITDQITPCTQTLIDTESFVLFSSTPDTVEWTSASPNVNIFEPNAEYPQIEISVAGDYTLNVKGKDVCGEDFLHDVPISILPGKEVILSDVDDFCEIDDPANLLDYVTPSDFIVSCNGSWVNECQFDPAQAKLGDNIILLTDSCNIVHELNITVLSEGTFSIANQTICISDTINLNNLQTGTYLFNGVADSLFYNSEAGNYRIDYLANSNCAKDGFFTVEVLDKPSPGFTIDYEPCNEDSTTYALGSTFSFTLSEENHPTTEINYFVNEEAANTFKPDMPGLYTIKQIVRNGMNCADSVSRTISIEAFEPPTIAIPIVNSSQCDSVNVELSAEPFDPNNSYEWQIGNYTASGQNPTITIPRTFVPNTLTATLSVESACFPSNDLESEPFIIPIRSTVALDIKNNNNTACSGDTVYFQNASTTFDSLSFDDGMGNLYNEVPESLVYLNETGIIQNIAISLTGFKAGCPNQTDTASLQLKSLNTEASFSFESISEDGCSPETVVIENSSTPGALDIMNWGDGKIDTLSSLEEFTHIYTSTVDTTYTIQLTSKLCGIDDTIETIKVNATPIVDFDYLFLGGPCVNDSVQLLPQIDHTTIQSYNWDAGFWASTESAPVLTFPSTGDYLISLNVVSENGCPNKKTKPITIFNYTGPQLLVNVPNIVCAQVNFEVEVIQAAETICINDGDGVSSSEPIMFSYPNAGEHVLEVITKDENGCAQDTTILITALQPIDIQIIPQVEDTLINVGDAVELAFEIFPADRDIEQIMWTGNLIDNPTEKVIEVFPVESGTYTIEVADKQGCTAQDQIRINIKENLCPLFQANAFSPNGDGINEFFYLQGNPNVIKNIEVFSVHNRFGQVVFTIKNPPLNEMMAGWDGLLNNIKQPIGVYTWHAVVQLSDDSVTDDCKGNVTLIR